MPKLTLPLIPNREDKCKLLSDFLIPNRGNEYKLLFKYLIPN